MFAAQCHSAPCAWMVTLAPVAGRHIPQILHRQPLHAPLFQPSPAFQASVQADRAIGGDRIYITRFHQTIAISGGFGLYLRTVSEALIRASSASGERWMSHPQTGAVWRLDHPAHARSSRPVRICRIRPPRP